MAETSSPPGTLYVVATPIGNLEDLTFRALRTLKEVDLIAAEDTRRTRKLLSHYGLSTPMTSLHEHNEYEEAPRLVARLLQGTHVAVVSDAGTPGISDPGATLVRLARDAGIKVVPIPGPSAVTAALSVSGLAFDSFTFMGFPPASGAARSDWFDRLACEERVVVFFESPHRAARTLGDLKKYCAERPIITLREISKFFEELVIRTMTSGLEGETGEFVFIVGSNFVSDEGVETQTKVLDLFGRMTNVAGLSEYEASIAAGAVLGLTPSRIKNIVKKTRYASLKHEPMP